jgi:aryl-alcohol dehydrogenase-like predicted oxidoreductase
MGVIPIAHTPLDGGFATCAYTMTNPSGGRSGGSTFPYSQKKLEKWQPLTSTMEAVQSRVKTRLEKEGREQQQMMKDYRAQPPQINKDVTTTQIALNYVIAKGCVPIPGVKTVAQAEEVLGCLGWGLTDEEVRMLDSAADAAEKGLSI